ncbi:MAG: hypothetical protein JWN33_506 [Candidatus Saccharibacteria bacterium]|nr:hypothetical protein [Candidatus Saccharibacteria bacterium]
MEKPMSSTLSLLLWVLAFLGFIKKKKHVAGLMNIDTSHSIIRLPIASLLLLGSKSDVKTARNILLGSGLIYVLIGTAGTINRKAFGLLPSKLTGFDLVYHFVVGAAAIYMGTRSGRMLKP